MPRFPAVTAKEVIRAVKKLGFEFSRQSGTSHAVAELMRFDIKSDRLLFDGQ